MFNHSFKKNLIYSLCCILLVIGLYISLRIVFAIFRLEADSTQTIMLWYGITEHGLFWIKDWIATQDSWILSLLPIHFLLFSIFGAKFSVVLIFGWLIYIFSAVVAGAIAWTLGAKKSAVFIFLALINLGLYAHVSGYVAYSATHNITNLFGLLTILLLLFWASKPSWIVLILLFILLFTGGFSDPWMLASYNVPVAILALILSIFPNTVINITNAIKLLAVSLISIVLIQTQVFGIFSFLPNVHFKIGNWTTISSNFIFLIKDLGGMLNIVPFINDNNLLTSSLSILVWIAVLSYCVYTFIRNKNRINSPEQILFLLAFLSFGGIAASFIITAVVNENNSARFLINCVYMLVICIGFLTEIIWQHITKLGKSFIITIFILFVSSGLLSNAMVLTKFSFKINDANVSDIVNILQKNNLSYGYGSFWDAKANAITVVSKNKIRMRPIVYNAIGRVMFDYNRPITSKQWYREQDIPLGQEYFFILISPGLANECPDIDNCIKWMKKDFGNPVRTIQEKDITILVWNHKLINSNATSSK